MKSVDGSFGNISLNTVTCQKYFSLIYLLMRSKNGFQVDACALGRGTTVKAPILQNDTPQLYN